MSFLNKTPTKTKTARSRGSSVFEDQDARAFLKEAINDLMVRKDRRTKLEYFRITSSPTAASPSISTSSSVISSLKKQKVAPRRMSPEPPLLRSNSGRRTTVRGLEKPASKKVHGALSSTSSRHISTHRRLTMPVTSHNTPLSSRPSALATTTSSSGVKSLSTTSLDTHRKSIASNGPSKSRRGSASKSETKKHRTSGHSTSSGVRKSRRASKLARKSRGSSVGSGASKSDASVKSASSGGKGRSHASTRSASGKRKSRASIRSASSGKGKGRPTARFASADLKKSSRMSPGSASSGTRESRTLVRSASVNADSKKRRDSSFFLDGPEYRRWLADSNANNRVAVPTAMVPVRGRVEVSGVFKSQLAKYRPQDPKDRENIESLMQKRREVSGAENPPWTPQTSQVSVATTRTLKPEPRMRNPLFGQSITPKQMRHAEKVLGKRFGISTSLKNLCRSTSIKSKKFTTSTVSHPSSLGAGTGVNSTNGTTSRAPMARSGSTAALFSATPSSASQHLRRLLDTPRPLPLTFTPVVFSTPSQPVRRTMSELALGSTPPLARATQSLHATPTTSSSVYRTPVRKTPPTKSWLIDVAKQMERAHSEGRRAVLSTQTPLGTRAARRPRSLTPPPSVRSLSNGSSGGRVPVPIRSRSASASVSPSKKPVLVAPTPAPRTVSLAPVAKKSITVSKPTLNVSATSSGGNEPPKFSHNKKIKMRLLVDQNEHIDADCSLHFESSSRNPKIKVTELRVDDRPIWRKGASGGGNASLNNNGSFRGGSNSGSAASSPSSVSTASSSTGLYYQTPPSAS